MNILINSTEIKEKEYLDFEFIPELNNYINFYKCLSISSHSFATPGTNTVWNLDSYIFDAIASTLDSIKKIVIDYKLSDVYSLIRKYYDSIFINVYEMLFLTTEINLENFLENKVNDWVLGNEKLPDYGKLKEYINKSKRFSEINQLLYSDNRYTLIRDRANNFTHYNFFKYVIYNENNTYNTQKLGILRTLSSDLKDLFCLHFIYTFDINQHYMSASDYSDYIESGQIPPDNCQYFVAPFIQETFDCVIKNHREDLASLLKSRIEMKLS